MVKFLLLAFVALSGPVFSQQTWYVDPDSGDDNNDGTTTSAPLRTLGFALSKSGNGDQVQLLPGTLDSANDGEVFPIVFVDGVDILQPFSDPISFIFSGNSNPGPCFRLNSVMTSSISLTGVTITGFDSGVEVVSGASSGGQPFLLDNCVFQGFVSSGVDIKLDVPAVGGVLTEIFWITNCTFAPSTGNFGVRIRVADGAILATGLVADCTLSNCDVAISMEAEPGGSITSTTSVLRNFLSGVGVEAAGILFSAEADFSNNASNSCSAVANGIGGYLSNSTGGFLDAGLKLHAKSVSGKTATISGDISHNLIAENGTNVWIQTENNGNSFADVTSSFVGNAIINAKLQPFGQAGGSGNGIFLDVTLPRFSASNMAPNFGDTNISFGFGANGGRNTIHGNENFNIVMDSEMQNSVLMENNFWSQVTIAGIQNTISDLGALSPDFIPFLFDNMTASISPSTVAAGIKNWVTVNAGSFSAFVDVQDEDSAISRMLIVLSQGNTVIDSLDPTMFSTGTGTGFTTEVPELVSGLYSMVILNPGGQIAVATLRTQTSNSGGSATGCFVASAVHGDADAKEVRVLRRFRDDYLLATSLGQSLVRSYYLRGPAWATWLETRPSVRRVVRAGLAPPVVLAEALLRWTALIRFAAGFLLLGLAFRLLRHSSSVSSDSS